MILLIKKMLKGMTNIEKNNYSLLYNLSIENYLLDFINLASYGLKKLINLLVLCFKKLFYQDL